MVKSEIIIIVPNVDTLKTCPNNYFLDYPTLKCSYCDTNCQQCSYQFCQDCLIGRNLDGSCISQVTECSDSSYYDVLKKRCVPCTIPFCSKCLSESQCFSCEDQFTRSTDDQCIFKDIKQNKIKDPLGLVFYKQSQPIKIQQSYSCPPMYYHDDTRNLCVQQHFCSIQQFNPYSQFTDNIKQVLQYQNFVIALSSKQVIVYDEQANSREMKQQFQLINLISKENENIRNAFMIDFNILIFTNKNVWVYNINKQRLICIVPFQQEILEQFKNDKFLWFDSLTQRLYYLSLDSEYSAITLSIFKIQNQTDKDINMFKIILLDSYIILSNQETINQYAYFPQSGQIIVSDKLKITLINITQLQAEQKDEKIKIKSITDSNQYVVTFQENVPIYQDDIVMSEIDNNIYILRKQTNIIQLMKLIYNSQIQKYQISPEGFLIIDRSNFQFGFLFSFKSAIYCLSINTQQIKISDIQNYYLGKEIKYFYKVILLSNLSNQSISYQESVISLLEGQNLIVLMQSHNLFFIYLDQNAQKVYELIQLYNTYNVENTFFFTSINQYYLYIIHGKQMTKIPLLQFPNQLPYITFNQYKEFTSQSQLMTASGKVSRFDALEDSENGYNFIITQLFDQQGYSITQIDYKNGNILLSNRFFLFKSSDTYLTTSSFLDTERKKIIVILSDQTLSHDYYTLKQNDLFNSSNIKREFIERVSSYIMYAQFEEIFPGFSTQNGVICRYKNGSIMKIDGINFTFYKQQLDNTYVGEYLFSLNSFNENIFAIMIKQYQEYKFDTNVYEDNNKIFSQDFNEIYQTYFYSEYSIAQISKFQDNFIQYIRITKFENINTQLVSFQNVDLKDFEQPQLVEFGYLTDKSIIYFITDRANISYNRDRSNIRVFFINLATGSQSQLDPYEDFRDRNIYSYFKFEGLKYVQEKGAIFLIYRKIFQLPTYFLKRISIQYNLFNGSFVVNSQTDYGTTAYCNVKTQQDGFQSCGGDQSLFDIILPNNFNQLHIFFSFKNRLGFYYTKFLQSSQRYFYSDNSNLYSLQNIPDLYSQKGGIYISDNSMRAMSFSQNLFFQSELDSQSGIIEIKIYSLDTFSYLSTIPQTFQKGDNLYWNENFQKLLIIRDVPYTVYVYDSSNGFSTPLYINQLSASQLQCSLLSLHPILACTKFGIYKYLTNEIFLNDQIIGIKGFWPIVYENRRYTYFGEIKQDQLVCFDTKTNKYCNLGSIPSQLTSIYQPRFTLFNIPELENQAVFQPGFLDNYCLIVELPSLKVLKKISSTSIDNFHCFYFKTAPYIFLKTDEKIVSVKLPYRDNLEVVFNTTSIFYKQSSRDISTDTNYFYIEIKEVEQGQSIMYAKIIDLTTGEQKTIQTGYGKEPFYMVGYYEEKQILVTDQQIISLIDGTIMFSFSNKEDTIIGLNQYYNYMIVQIEEQGSKRIVSIDISDIFPSTPSNRLQYNQYQLQNRNLYDQEKKQIIYMNYEHLTIEMLDSQQNKIIMNNLYNSFNDKQELQFLKTLHKIFQFGLDVYGYFYQCQIVIFKFNTTDLTSTILFEKYLVMDFRCNIFLLSNNIYYFNYKTNQLFNLRNNLRSMQFQEVLVYESSETVTDIQEITQNTKGTNDFLLLQIPNQEKNIILINVMNNLKMETQMYKMKITCSKAYYSNSKQYFLIGTQYNDLTELQIVEDQIQFNPQNYVNFQEQITNLDLIVSSNIQYYATTVNRIYLIKKDKNDKFQTVVSSPLHTTRTSYLKILESKIIAVHSATQVTFYSQTLEAIGFIQESILIQISNIFISKDLSTLLIQDSQGIYIFNLYIKYKTTNQRLRLIKQFQNFIVPTIMKLDEESTSNQLIILGADTKHAFEIVYQNDQQYFVSQNNQVLTQYKDDCTLYIKDYEYKWQQKMQYIDIINSLINEDEIKVIIKMTQGEINPNKPTKELFIPSSIEVDENHAKKKIYIDVDINQSKISLLQNPNIILHNVESLKLQNGILVLNQPYIMQDLLLFQLKDITLEVHYLSYLKLTNVAKIVFDNVKLQFIIDSDKEQFNNIQKYIFEFINSNLVILNQIDFQFKGLKVLQKDLFLISDSQNIIIKDITIKNLKFSQTLIHIYNNLQLLQVNSFNISQSTVGILFKIEKANEISLKSINLIQCIQQKSNIVNVTNGGRILQQLDQRIVQSLIIIQYAIKQTVIQSIRMDNCNLISFLSYNNTYSYDITDNINSIIISKNSKLIIEDLKSFSKTTFDEMLILVEEKEIEFRSFQITKSLNPCIEIISALTIAYFENISFTENDSIKYPFIKIQNSQFYAKVLNFIDNENKIDLLSNDQSKVIKKKNIEILNSNFLLLQIKSNNTNLGSYFLGIHTSDLNGKKIDSNFTAYELNSIVNLDLTKANNGGVLIENVQKIIIKDSQIYHNQCLQNGAGIHLNYTESCQLVNVDILFNKAGKYGGGVYIQDSDLSLKDSKILFNSAKIGGGIRYNNQIKYPTFLKQDLNQIINNQADIFGSNYGSNPTHLKVLTSLDDVVSSLNQQKTKIQFQLYGEDGNIVMLTHQNKFSADIFNELQTYQLFNLQTEDNNNVIVQKDVENSSYKELQNLFQFETCLTNIGYNKILTFKQNNQELPIQTIKIQSKFTFPIPNNSQITAQFISLNLQIKFRDCKPGEVIKRVSSEYYECLECEENSYSLQDPYSNNLQNQCKPCPKGSSQCYGNKIIPQERYWRDGETDYLQYCENNPQKCTQINSVNGCSIGSTGPLCESCDYNNLQWKDHTYGKKNRYECSICGEVFFSLNQYLLPGVIGVIFILYILYQIIDNQHEKMMKLKAIYLKRAEIIHVSSSLNEGEKTQVIIKILISYFQLISIVQNFNIRLPDEIQKILFFFGNTIETTYYSLDCLFKKSGLSDHIKIVYLRLLWSILTPVIYLIILLIIFLFLRKTKYIKRQKNTLISGAFQFYYMFYTSLIQQTFGTLSCRVINETSYVLLDVQFECYDSQYLFYNLLFSLPVLIIILLIPVQIYRNLKQHRQNLLKIEVYLNYGFYFSEYKESFYYWELIKMWQKIIVYIIINTFNQSNVISSMIISITIIFYMKYQTQNKPFQYHIFNQLDLQSQTTAILTIFFCLININTSISVIQIISIVLAIVANVALFSNVVYLFLIHLIRYNQYSFIRKLMLSFSKILRRSIVSRSFEKRNFYKMNKNWALLKDIVRSKKLLSFYYDSQQKALGYYTQQTQTQTQIRYNRGVSWKVPNPENKLLKSSQDSQNKTVKSKIIQTPKDLSGQVPNQRDRLQSAAESFAKFQSNTFQTDQLNQGNTNVKLSVENEFSEHISFQDLEQFEEENTNQLDFQKKVIRNGIFIIK